MDEHNKPPADVTDKLPDQTRKTLADQVRGMRSEQVPDAPPEQVADAGWEQVRGVRPKVREQLADRVAEVVPEQVVAEVPPEQVVAEVPPEQVLGVRPEVREQLADQVAEVVPEQVVAEVPPEQVVAEVPPEQVLGVRPEVREQLADQVAEVVPEQVVAEVPPEQALAEVPPEQVAAEVPPEQVADARWEQVLGVRPEVRELPADQVAEVVPEQVADVVPEQAADVPPEQAADVPPEQMLAEVAGRAAGANGVGDVVLGWVGVVGRRFGVGAGGVVEVVGGVANRGFVVGERLFLRVARPGFEGDLRKEIAVIPVARAAGVLTPAVVEYDESRTVIGAPYVVMERVHGSEPIDVPTGLGEQLARLHRAQGVQIPGLPEDGWGDPWRTVDDLADRGYLDLGTAKWLAAWFTRLAGRFDRDRPKVLIHGDVAAHNLLATPDGRLTGLIDWGDAALAPAEVDFAKLPLEHVAAILPEYVHHTESAVPEEELAAATVWLHLEWALGKLPADPWPGQRHWTAPPASRVLGILRFFASAPPAPWSTLT